MATVATNPGISCHISTESVWLNSSLSHLVKSTSVYHFGKRSTILRVVVARTSSHSHSVVIAVISPPPLEPPSSRHGDFSIPPHCSSGQSAAVPSPQPFTLATAADVRLSIQQRQPSRQPSPAQPILSLPIAPWRRCPATTAGRHHTLTPATTSTLAIAARLASNAAIEIPSS